MDWWQEMDFGNGTQLVCLPMQHWSRRIGQGFNDTLWASFMLITPEVTIYLGGDSGYFIGYKEIAKRFPGIDYALLPTTAYHPRWFMHYNHMNVDEAIEAFHDLNARFMIPQQWGTFHLGDEPPGYPALELKRKISLSADLTQPASLSWTSEKFTPSKANESHGLKGSFWLQQPVKRLFFIYTRDEIAQFLASPEMT
jgi:L-ascorbate metabolism protein UlaG (beta-lactamase superfamily)